jgi:hypothetical protein
MSRTIICPAQLDGYSPRKDRTIGLRFITQEMTPDQVSNIHQLLDGFGYLYFKTEHALTRAEQDELDALETDLIDNAKTKSKRLRNVLYRLWEKDNEGHADFKDFYAVKMESIIEWIKGKLD